MTAEEWNARHPIGTPVIFVPVAGEPDRLYTRTRSLAWNLGNGEPVVLVEYRTGGVALSHLVLRAEAPAPCP